MNIQNTTLTSGRRVHRYLNSEIQELVQEVDSLSEEKVTLPTTGDVVNHGTAGQFAVSDGKGGITWKTLYEAEEVSY